jgi:hypothetical protein
MAGYFFNFPIIKYESDNTNTLLRNILVRGNLRESSKNTVLQTLNIKEGDRSDYLAHLLFQNSSYDYLFYLLNDIIDPYYEWYLSQKQLDQYILDKYNTTKNDPKYYKLKIQQYYVDDIIVKYGGNNYSNSDYLVISGGFIDAFANLTTNSTGGIISTTLTQKGSDINSPVITFYDANSNKIIKENSQDNAKIAPIIFNTETSSNNIVINTDTYNMLSNNQKLDYVSVTNTEYEYDENEKRRFLNAVIPSVGYKIDSEIKNMLKGAYTNLK